MYLMSKNIFYESLNLRNEVKDQNAILKSIWLVWDLKPHPFLVSQNIISPEKSFFFPEKYFYFPEHFFFPEKYFYFSKKPLLAIKPSFTTFYHFCPLLPLFTTFTTFAHFYHFLPLLPTFAYFCPLLPTFAHFYHFLPLLPTFTFTLLKNIFREKRIFGKKERFFGNKTIYFGRKKCNAFSFLVCILCYKKENFPTLRRNKKGIPSRTNPGSIRDIDIPIHITYTLHVLCLFCIDSIDPVQY